MSALRRARDERGAALVEFAIVVPLLITIAMGLLDFGLAWRTSLTVSSGVRAGARVGSGMGNDRFTDHSILQALNASLDADDVHKIVVYKSTTDDGAVPQVCKDASPGASVAGCNIYDGASLALPRSAFEVGSVSASGDYLSCGGGPDASWCPVSRYNSQVSPGPDYLGVWVDYRHDFVSGWFPAGGLDIKDNAVMRLEPPEQI